MCGCEQCLDDNNFGCGEQAMEYSDLCELCMGGEHL